MAEQQHIGKWTGNKNPRWNGGVRESVQGYIYIKTPGHPHATKDGYVLEHRLVMESHIGRYLLPAEVVHHKNDITTDNRLENLELFPSNVEHIRATVDWSKRQVSEDGLRRMDEGRRRAGKSRQGESNVRSRFTKSQILDIRRRHADGESQTAIGRDFAASQGTIANIINRKTWRHI